jgi:Tol biopolymer transport system component/imidazolonepropionase-like amidohydrolase
MAVSPPASAQTEVEEWDVTQPRGQTREIDFTTDEGTWMSLDVSPDGRWIVFDLLGHIYRVPAAGGEAQVLTQESGIAVNYHPRVSPDGRFIAFISDRRGQENLWVMEADGSSPRPVVLDDALRLTHPVWTADGRYIVVERQVLAEPGFIWGLWMYHVDGGTGVELLPAGPARPSWPSVSADGRHLYYHAVDEALSRYADAVRGARQLRCYEFATGAIVAVTAGTEGRQNHASSGGAYAPETSPDGRRLAFARRIPDGTISYKGHRFGPRTALWLRDLETGAERLAMDPIEVDMTETGKRLRALPGYAWTPDGRSIVLTQGGKLRRLDVETGEVATIPFRARVRRTISEQARGSTPITDGPFEAKFLRWYTASPDGRVVLFQAVGKIWAARRPDGGPRRLTDETFAPFEFSPAWSPDGQWVAFTTWDERERGHLWKVRAGGGRPERLTEQAGEYIHPVWSPDGSYLVVARGAGGTARGRTWRRNPWFDLVRVPAGGGPATFLVREATSIEGVGFFGSRRHAPRASYGPDGRVFYPERWSGEDAADEAIALASVAPDGTDKRVHLTFPYADDIVTSPDGEYVAFVEGDNVYLAPFPWMKTGSGPVHVEKKGGTLPVQRVSREGGLYPTWIDASTLGFGSGARFYAYDVRSQRADTFAIHLSIPRDLPTGTIALSGARIVTLDERRVIERGVVLVRGSRIACLGECDVAVADRVLDVSGTTIIPGFVDMHAHHYSEHHGIVPAHNYETAIYLAYGVTTDLDPAAWAQTVFPTAELIEAGKVIGPRAFGTGDPLHRRDGTHWNEITSYEVAEADINRLASWGAVSIKQYVQPLRRQRQWIADVARKRGLTLTAEGGSLPFNLGLIMDGHTGWEHALTYLITYGDVAKFFGRAKTVYSPTFVVGGGGRWWDEDYFIQERDVWKDEKLRRFTPWRKLIPHLRRRTLRPPTDYGHPFLAQTLADMIAEGGYGAIGSHGQQHGIAPHWEVWMAATALGPMGALEVASLHGAYFLGAERDIGSIEVGKLADLVVLNANPLEDIRNTVDIRYVMKGGRLWNGETLDELWPREIPFGEYYWVDPDVLRTDDRPVTHFER